MARGLSDLQKYILKTAAESTPLPYRRQGEIYNFEICEGYYGWKPGVVLIPEKRRMPYPYSGYMLKEDIPRDCEHEWTSTGGEYPRWKCGKCEIEIQPPNREHMGASKNFEPLVVGEKKYNAVQVAIHKAVERLEKRGLAERIGGYAWRGVAITEKGREVVAGWDKAETA